MDSVYIYGLIDPRNRQIHYVGHTTDMLSRLDGHLRDAADTPKTKWIKSVTDNGFVPEVVVLDIVDYEKRFNEEYKWIYIGRSRNWPLTNTLAMKSAKYSDWAESIKQVLIVEVEKGLTWGKIKQYGSDLWIDNDKWLMFSFYSSIVGLIPFSIACFLLIMWGPNMKIERQYWVIILMCLSSFIFSPFVFRRLYQIVSETIADIWRIAQSAMCEYKRILNNGG
jgi:hypothetical protein